MCAEMCAHISLRLTDLLVSLNLVGNQPGSESQNLVTDQPKPFIQLDNVQWDIVMFCNNDSPMNTTMEYVGVKHWALG
jgi:hypothetical protein